MTIEDFLLPGEEVKFHSSHMLNYADNYYELFVTDRRLLFYAQRGMLFKKDDVISQKLDEIQNIKYREKGMLNKLGIIEVDARTKFEFSGKSNEVKAIYQQVLQFF